MQVFKHAVWLCAALSLSACGGPEETAPALDGTEHLSTQEHAATSGTSQGCSFSVFSFQRFGSQPPIYDTYVSRSATSTCPYTSTSLLLGSSYNPSSTSLAANDLGVAVSFTIKATPSGSANTQCLVKHVTPDTLTVMRTETLVVMYGAGNVTSCNLAISSDGTTLTAGGNKTGPLPGQTGSPTGTHYTATYPDFFTSTTPPSYFSY